MNTDQSSELARLLLAFFEQVSIKRTAQLSELQQQPGFYVDSRCWQFTLPELFTFIQQQMKLFESIEYSEFRKILFNSPINQTIKMHGAEIVIVTNHNKVDKTLYAMTWKEIQHDRS